MNRDRLREISHGASPSEPAFKKLDERREAKHRRRRLEAAVVGLTLCALVLAGLFTFLPSDRRTVPGGTGGTNAPARNIPETGKYYYRDLVFFLGKDGGGLSDPFRMQTWATPNGSGRLVYGPPATDAWMYGMPVEKGGNGQSKPADITYDTNESPFSFIDLSSDPAKALAQLNARSAEGGASPNPVALASPGAGQTSDDLKLMRVLEDLLTDDAAMIASPQSQQGLFGVMARLPEVTTVDSTTDPVGRPAIALVYNVKSDRSVFYFDPSTHLLLASAGGDTRVVLSQGYSDSTTVPDPKDSLIPTTTTADAAAGAQNLQPPTVAG